MAYDEQLADRVRRTLARHAGVTERKMFGGIAFLLHGNMCCGVLKDELIVRVGADGYDGALAQPHARPIDFTGRAIKGFVYVGRGGYRTERGLAAWVGRGVDFVSALPKKQAQRKRPIRPRRRA
jgi:TfoX/Sxy family transcriptional regulator of competence genes